MLRTRHQTAKEKGYAAQSELEFDSQIGQLVEKQALAWKLLDELKNEFLSLETKVCQTPGLPIDSIRNGFEVEFCVSAEQEGTVRVKLCLFLPLLPRFFLFKDGETDLFSPNPKK